MKGKKQAEVTAFLDVRQPPLRKEIEALRTLILTAGRPLIENIKWNGPNYCANGQDRLTMKIQPPKNIQLILHRGALKQAQPAKRLLSGNFPWLSWKENDRAVATFYTTEEIKNAANDIQECVRQWIDATRTA
ncbi:MAG: DUF1801 domain-containing protein [Chitinophagaceae bacterium]|nr:MAG: DUF1801 domain-containing protein [Chitinophagaceae bacterium]